jgi:D-3-phosphoglycerate dehydrogenase / 2-oxoglutarate reductase
VALLTTNGCVCRFGIEFDGSDAIAQNAATFQPDGLIVRKGIINEAVIEASPALKVIAKHGVGVDNIDTAAATKHGIPVLIAAGANCEAVAEHALALIFALSRRIAEQDRKMRLGIWDKKNYRGGELRGKCLGLVGFGRIGKRLHELVRPLEMHVLYFDPYVPDHSAAHRVSTLTELLCAADIVSLHCPLTPDTRCLIGRKEFAIMKPGAFIVNTARGAVLDEAALIEALQEKRIGAAGLDTFENEPPDRGNPLFAMENVIATPHVGAFSEESFRNMGTGAAENVLTVLAGKPPDPGCLVNPEALKVSKGKLGIQWRA